MQPCIELSKLTCLYKPQSQVITRHEQLYNSDATRLCSARDNEQRLMLQHLPAGIIQDMANCLKCPIPQWMGGVWEALSGGMLTHDC